MVMIICLVMKMALRPRKEAKLNMLMSKDSMKMSNISMIKHLEKRSFLKLLDLPVMLITAMLHLLLVELLLLVLLILLKDQGNMRLHPEIVMGPQPVLELKVNILHQELLTKSTVLLVNMRGTREALRLQL